MVICLYPSLPGLQCEGLWVCVCECVCFEPMSRSRIFAIDWKTVKTIVVFLNNLFLVKQIKTFYLLNLHTNQPSSMVPKPIKNAQSLTNKHQLGGSKTTQP